MFPTRRPARLAIVAALLVAAPAASAQAPGPTTQTRTAAARLVADTQSLTDAQAPAAVRTSLLQNAKRAEALFLRDPCRSIAYLERYRALLPKVDGTTPKTARGEPGPPSVRGRLDRTALAV